MDDYILQVKNLKQYFPIRGGVFQRTVGWIKAVDGVSFNIKRGETLGVVGNPDVASLLWAAALCVCMK